MGLIRFNHKGNFNNTERFFNRVLKRNYLNILEKYGQLGVEALRANTPSDSGKTADSWGYGIERGDGLVTIYWTNSNENDGVNIAILLIYGHGLHNGGYVQGFDFVNPSIRPIFEQMAQESWKEVTAS
jgi:hypothetical protein